jgi:hypothetical protein
MITFYTKPINDRTNHNDDRDTTPHGDLNAIALPSPLINSNIPVLVKETKKRRKNEQYPKIIKP